MFNCPLCTKTYKSRYSLNSHVTIHNNEKPYKCSKCPKSYRSSNHLKYHVKVVHDGMKEYKCPTCSYAGSTRSQMTEHARTHWVERPFSCSVPGCGFKTKTKKYLPIHRRRVHELQERIHECQIAGCKFKAKCLATRRTHAFTHRSERPFSCTFPECDHTNKRKADLTGHTKRVHCAEKSFKCSTCGYQTNSKAYLRLHEDSHLELKRFPCQAPNCSFASNCTRRLRLHFDSKHRTKNVACTAPGCAYKCGSITLLKKHDRTHVLPIQNCPGDSCNYNTRLPKNMRRHIASWHKELKPSSQGKRVKPNLLPVTLLICRRTDCEYQTEFPHLYDRHNMTHENDEYQHTCQLCYLRFQNGKDLGRHVQSHTKERPFSCSLCSFTTVIFTYLRLHAKNFHGIDVAHGEVAVGIENNNCRACNAKLGSSKELVLHSMSHLNAVVVLERLLVHSS